MKKTNLNGQLLRNIIFLATLILLTFRVAIILKHFNFLVTDNDQALFWYACDNFSQGHFYTPFIYGCNYGSMLESLLAVPFYKAGIPIYYALPLSNAFWVLGLVSLLALSLNKKYKSGYSGTLFLIVFALLPTEFFAILFAAKGHLAGIIVSLISFILVLNANSKLTMILVGLLAGLAFQLNPNSLFLLFFVGFFVESVKDALYCTFGVLISGLYIVITSYYSTILDSEFLHKQWQIEFSLSELGNNLSYIDKYLNSVTPFDHAKGYISLVILLIFVVTLFTKKMWIKGFWMLLTLLFVVFSFGVNKVSDGSADVLFHYSRFFLALAFCSSITFSLILTYFNLSKWYGYIASSGIAFILMFIYSTTAEANQLTDYSGTTYSVRKSLIKDLKKNCDWMIKILNEKKDNRTQIVYNDVVFYSENLYLSTLHLPMVKCCFEKYKSFYWLDQELRKDKGLNDVYFVINFDKTMERKRKEYPQFLYLDTFSSYFLVQNVRNPVPYIENFVK